MGVALLATAASLYMQGLLAAPRPAAYPATDRYRQVVLTIGCGVAFGLLVTISSVGAARWESSRSTFSFRSCRRGRWSAATLRTLSR
jgi:hypothetical protein